MPLQANQMSVHEILEMIFQNKWLFLGCTFLGLLVGFVIVDRTEKWYESKADVQVVDLNASEPLLKGLGVTTTANQRFTMARTRLLAETVLEEMVAALKTSEKYRGHIPHLAAMSGEAAVASLKGKLGMELRSGVINIHIERKDPGEAWAIVDYMQGKLIGELGAFDEKRWKGTNQVLESLLDTYRSSLDQSEEKLRDFATFHQVDLAGTKEDLLTEANTLEATADTPKGLVARFVGMVDRHSRNEVDLQALAAKRKAQLEQIKEEPEFRVQEVLTGQSEMHKQMETLLGEAMAELEKIRQDRTDTHPDVMEKMEEIERYKAKLAENEVPVVRQEQKVANPIREALEMQASSLQGEIEAKQEEQKRILAQSRDLQERIKKIPQKELDKLRIQRELDIQEEMYKNIRLRYEQAQLTQKLERGEDRQEFIVLSKASRNEKPIRPNATFIYLMGTFVGVVMGIVLCFVREFTDTSFRSLEDASRFLDLPVLGVIPEVVGSSRRGNRHRKRSKK